MLSVSKKKEEEACVPFLGPQGANKSWFGGKMYRQETMALESEPGALWAGPSFLPLAFSVQFGAPRGLLGPPAWCGEGTQGETLIREPARHLLGSSPC